MGYLIESKSYYREPVDTGIQVTKLFKLENRHTCILVTDDFAMLGAIKVIQKSVLGYPDDISLEGYDGIFLYKIISSK